NFLQDYDQVFNSFEQEVGFSFLRGIHLNDSKKEVGSRVDRHDSIGQGYIGNAFFERLMKDTRFDNLPIILETPDETLWAKEIAWLRAISQG
ncbi:MAG TPA: TIM barrel protein, partial [Bacteroides graminisolvens]|nr:TIM barrel protein [Bacteroides graminisolvens]